MAEPYAKLILIGGRFDGMNFNETGRIQRTYYIWEQEGHIVAGPEPPPLQDAVLYERAERRQTDEGVEFTFRPAVVE